MSQISWASVILCCVSAGANEPVEIQDFSKRAIEAPTERLVDRSQPPPPLAPPPPSQGESNPDKPVKVRPGDVNWHPNATAACAASKNSGKPVLLLQLLGRLDEEFT